MCLFRTKRVVVVLVLLGEYNGDKKFWKGFLFFLSTFSFKFSEGKITNWKNNLVKSDK